MYKLFIIILSIICNYCVYKLTFIHLCKRYGRKCNYNCNNCKMWSCTYGTDYVDYKIIPYNDYSKFCGKF